jgi:hypothetical protein
MTARPEFQALPTGAPRIRYLCQRVDKRDPTAEEIGLGPRLVEAKSAAPAKQAEKASADSKEPALNKPLNPWEEYAQVLLMSNELMFVD